MVREDMDWIFEAQVTESYIDMVKIDIVAETGGLLSPITYIMNNNPKKNLFLK